MAWRLRVLIVLTENLGSAPNTHMVAHNHPVLGHPMASLSPYVLLHANGAHKLKQTHKIKITYTEIIFLSAREGCVAWLHKTENLLCLYS